MWRCTEPSGTFILCWLQTAGERERVDNVWLTWTWQHIPHIHFKYCVECVSERMDELRLPWGRWSGWTGGRRRHVCCSTRRVSPHRSKRHHILSHKLFHSLTGFVFSFFDFDLMSFSYMLQVVGGNKQHICTAYVHRFILVPVLILKFNRFSELSQRSQSHENTSPEQRIMLWA